MSGQGGSEQIEVASRRPGTGECRNERHRARLASRPPDDGTHRYRAGEALKMLPSAARVACIARAACTGLDQNSNNKETYSEQSGTMVRVQGL